MTSAADSSTPEVPQHRILLTGVPGTGKTALGEFLASSCDFHHVDMEADDFAPVDAFRAHPKRFLRALRPYPRVVLTWGFGPLVDRPLVDRLMKASYVPVWLDGNRVASLRAFLDREQGDSEMEQLYYEQMAAVMSSGVLDDLSPMRVNPFRSNGAFRTAGAVAAEVLAVTSPSL